MAKLGNTFPRILRRTFGLRADVARAFQPTGIPPDTHLETNITRRTNIAGGKSIVRLLSAPCFLRCNAKVT